MRFRQGRCAALLHPFPGTLRIDGLGGACIAALLVLLAGAKAAGAQHLGHADEIHWTFTGPSSVTLNWRGTTDLVFFGLTPSRYQSFDVARTPVPDPISSEEQYHEVRLTGLYPDAVYHYSVGGGPDHTFRTPPRPGTSDFTVMAIGDVGDGDSYGNVVKVQKLIADEEPRFVLMVGDLTYGNAHGQDAVDQHFNDVMVWSQDAAYMPAWGNHEWDRSTDDLRNYKGRFDLPNPQTSPGSPSVSCCGEDWYWFDYGNVRFIAYPEPWSGAWDDWSAKASALMDEAQSDPLIAYIVTFGHRPAYSSGHHPGDSHLRGIMDALGDRHDKYVLNINGHSHNYERTHPQHGVVHITAGIGGSSLEQDGTCLWYGGCPPPSFTAFRAMRHGALRLRFTRDAIEGTAICGPPGGGTNDVECTSGGSMDDFTIANPRPAISTGVPPGGGAALAARVIPNPIRGAGRLDFVAPRDGAARVELYDLRGRRVRLLMDGDLPAGSHQVPLDGRDSAGERLQPGVYFYRITASGQSVSGRVLLLQ